MRDPLRTNLFIRGSKMFLIISVLGCLPYLDLERDEEGTTMLFNTEGEAESYAKENCAWEYKVIEWN